MINRRTMLLTTATLPGLALASPLANALSLHSRNQEISAMSAFSLPDLPYAYNALEPVIDAETMELHHSRHHQTYVNGLNSALENRSDLQGTPLEDILARVSELPGAFRNHGGGHWNHTFFWESMIAPADSGAPSGAFAEAINAKFGSLEEMKNQFNSAGAGQFGSGWAWLIVNGNGELEITATPNQDNPLMDVAGTRGTPILGNDVWEHAYYVTYRNRRADYLAAWWQVVNWDVASERYNAAVAGN
ncbi:MAG TPA: superoxide dismutase [Oceanicaulis sp.]|uniref:Superoxide dismutase n=1 Tax=Glycocaulis albus TaxID=1382801 RepID=A0ABQ1XUG2_9PROT|nr:superoxide dismutase [Glycocaulis albus]HCY56679.1 superoxide dismutase [Oceanicaulis sp.]